MADAREMLDEFKDKAPEADPFPTISESLAELGANPDKYEKILAKTDDKFHWEKVFQPKTTLEAGAITLLAAAKQSGAEPTEYLSRLAPYFDARIRSLPDMYNVSGYVHPDEPNRAVMTRTARELKTSGNTLPHELEHTLQGFDPNNFPRVKVPGRPNTVLRFAIADSFKNDLQTRLAAIPEEERDEITTSHPVFGKYLSSGKELFARIRAKDMLDSAKGKDFLQTDLGQKLFPTDKDRAYFIGSTLPGVPTITPPYDFKSTEQNRKPLTDPNTSYARQLFNMLTAPKEFQEGGEVEKEASPDLAKAFAVLESDPLKYKSIYQYLLTKGDIANLNDTTLAKEDIAALGLVHAARLSNTEPETFIENLRPALQALPSKAPDVRPSVMVQGSSGGFNTRMPGINFDMPYVPENLQARLGAEADVGQSQVRAGVIGGAMRDPSTGVRFNPVMADVGFQTPVAGGTLNLGVNTGVQNPSAKNTNFMANYTRRFQEGGEVEIPEEQALPSTEAAKSLAQYKQTAAPVKQTQSVTPQFVMDGAALTRAAESGNNYNVGFNRAGTSDAFGAYQILSSTYKGIQAEDPYFLDKKQTSLTPEEQDRANQVLRNMNSKGLLAYNVAATEPNLQLAHFLGAKGAALFLKNRYISPAAAAANGGLENAIKIADQRLAMGQSIQEQKATNAPSAPPTQEPLIAAPAAPAAPMARQTASAALSPVDPPTKAATFSANDDLARSIAAFKVATQPPKTTKLDISKKSKTTKKRYAEGGEVTDEFPEEAGAMPGQSPSQAAIRLRAYKQAAAPKLPPGVVPDTGQLDSVYQEPTVASETARVFGMKPREDRLSILPYYSRATGFVAPEMLYDAARAITAPSVATRGYEVAPEEAVNTALNFMGAGVGTSAAMKKPAGEGGKNLGMFVGQKSETWDMDKYTSALDFEKAGINPAEINRLTGYWKNPSSKVWSQEISDHTASIIPNSMPKTLQDTALITDVLSHAPLFKAYPDLKNVIVKRSSGTESEGAKFDPRINTIFIGDKVTGPKTQLSYVLHELQHWVQTKENFPRGTSPEEIAKIETPEMAKINERLGQLFYKENRKDPKNAKEFKELMSQLRNLKRIQEDNAFALYNRTEGEAQARAMQERIDMDEPTRRVFEPLGNFDVPVTELIQMGDFGKLAPTSRVPGAPVPIPPPMRMALPSSTTARDDLAKVPGVLPKAERDANLNKMLEKSVVKEPVYHSTYSDFPEFKTNFGEDEYFQFGAHVGSVDAASNRLSLKQAEDAARGAKGSDTGANIMPVYAKITNPLRLDENRTGRWGVDDIMSTIMEKADAGNIKGIPPNIVDDFFEDNLQIEKFLGKKVKGEPRVWQNTMDWQPGERSKLLTEFIEKLGHDGIVYNNLFEGGGDSYLVLRPTQLKSATGNKGTYDTESPVLNKAKGGEVRKYL